MRCFILSLLLALFLVDVVVSLDKQRDCKCRIQSKKRIIGGREADPNSYPWQVSLQYKERDPVPDHLRPFVPNEKKIRAHRCGGNILNERWVLTAAHCVEDLDAHDLQVAYSDNDLVKMYERKLFTEVEEYIMHPEYKFNLIYPTNDIALVKLRQPLKINETVQPACLPATALPVDIYDGVLKAIGFGAVQQIVKEGDGWIGGALSRYLKEGNTYDLSNEYRMDCRKKYNICVENLVDESRDRACKGDSGGPLHHTKGGRSTVIGRSYFTRISPYMDWIKQHISSEQICV